MALREILEYPDPRLKERSVPVATFDDGVRVLAEDLIATLHASKAIGLCAPQVDDRRQVLVMDHSEDQSAPEVYVNPTIVSRAGFGFVEEQCLSVPGVAVNVLRATQVRVLACDASGAHFERELSGMPAVCLQHEMDHFDGKLLVDRLNWFKRRRFIAALNKAAAA